jgi:16S rRNA (guanine(966)-N(2))-methyltransferase RsmD
MQNKVRIIGGVWRSRIIKFPEQADLRPTPDRVRETLFNWLGQDLTGRRCLDLFAGSGALGFEAASRGADRVVLVERARPIAQALMTNARTLDAGAVEVVIADAIRFLRDDARTFDVVFLDPPYREALLPKLLPLLPAHLNPGALVYAEGDRMPEVTPAWEVWRQGQAGKVKYRLLKRTDGIDAS